MEYDFYQNKIEILRKNPHAELNIKCLLSNFVLSCQIQNRYGISLNKYIF